MVGDTGLTLSSRGVCHMQNQVYIRGENKDSHFRASDFADIFVENSCVFSAPFIFTLEIPNYFVDFDNLS